jgi:hypothetical protein
MIVVETNNMNLYFLYGDYSEIPNDFATHTSMKRWRAHNCNKTYHGKTKSVAQNQRFNFYYLYRPGCF